MQMQPTKICKNNTRPWPTRGRCNYMLQRSLWFLARVCPFQSPQHTLPLGSLQTWTLHLIVGCIVSNNVDVVITTLCYIILISCFMTLGTMLHGFRIGHRSSETPSCGKKIERWGRWQGTNGLGLWQECGQSNLHSPFTKMCVVNPKPQTLNPIRNQLWISPNYGKCSTISFQFIQASALIVTNVVPNTLLCESIQCYLKTSGGKYGTGFFVQHTNCCCMYVKQVAPISSFKGSSQGSKLYGYGRDQKLRIKKGKVYMQTQHLLLQSFQSMRKVH